MSPRHHRRGGDSGDVTILLNDSPIETSRECEEDGSGEELGLLGQDEDIPYQRPRRYHGWKGAFNSLLSKFRSRRAPSRDGIAGFCARCERKAAQFVRARKPKRATLICLGLFVLLGIIQLLTIAGSVLAAWYPDRANEVVKYWWQVGKTGEGLNHYPTDFTRDVVPVACHSHNDYWRDVPLYSGISAGCISTEADVWLYDGELFVGHDLASLTHNRTMDSLYIQPILEILNRQNPTTDFQPHGNTSMNGVFDTDRDQVLTLLIDLKTDGVRTFPAVISALQPLRDRGFLTFWDGDKVVERPIRAVGTGETPFASIVSPDQNKHKDIFFDAPLASMYEEPGEDEQLPKPESSVKSFGHLITSILGITTRSPASSAAQDFSDRATVPDRFDSHATAGSVPGHLRPPVHSTTNLIPTAASPAPVLPEPSYDPSNSYYASTSFAVAIGNMWGFDLTPAQLKKLRGQIKGAHARGLKARYWETPAWPLGRRNKLWTRLVEEGADVLNVDDLQGAAKEDWRRRKGWA